MIFSTYGFQTWGRRGYIEIYDIRNVSFYDNYYDDRILKP